MVAHVGKDNQLVKGGCMSNNTLNITYQDNAINCFKDVYDINGTLKMVTTILVAFLMMKKETIYH